jgi:hypothetical protein
MKTQIKPLPKETVMSELKAMLYELRERVIIHRETEKPQDAINVTAEKILKTLSRNLIYPK